MEKCPWPRRRELIHQQTSNPTSSHSAPPIQYDSPQAGKFGEGNSAGKNSLISLKRRSFKRPNHLSVHRDANTTQGWQKHRKKHVLEKVYVVTVTGGLPIGIFIIHLYKSNVLME